MRALWKSALAAAAAVGAVVAMTGTAAADDVDVLEDWLGGGFGPNGYSYQQDLVLFDPVGGHAELTVRPDGRWEFSGHLENPDILYYSVTASCALRFADGSGAVFSTQGELAGTVLNPIDGPGLPPDTLDWNLSGQDGSVGAGVTAATGRPAITCQVSNLSTPDPVQEVAAAAGITDPVVLSG